jgi:hypothetical protein
MKCLDWMRIYWIGGWTMAPVVIHHSGDAIVFEASGWHQGPCTTAVIYIVTPLIMRDAMCFQGW